MKTLLSRLLNCLPALLVALALLSAAGPSGAVETITYFHNDIAGTPLLATDAAGAVLWKENNRPYGDKLNNPPAGADNKLGFTGKPYDANTGLSYMGARYYDPVIGRFTGIDPLDYDEKNLHSFNRYAYANNNPYRYSDPDGKQAIEVKLLFGGWVFGVDKGSGQKFSTSSYGLVGLGVVVYNEYHFSDSGRTNSVGGCAECDRRADTSGYSFGLKLSAAVPGIETGINIAEGKHQYIGIVGNDGRKRFYEDHKDAKFDPKFYFETGYSPERDKSNPESKDGNRNKKFIGVKVDVSISKDSGTLKRWSD